jgi:peptide/nickel transport system permease protein
MAIFSPFLAPHDPWDRFEPYLLPGQEHPLGTNDLGQDILSELIYGSRVSLIVGFGAALIATIIGIIIGLLSGYFKGTPDEILMGITDIFLMIPQIPLIIVLAAFLRPSFWLVAVLMGCLWWTSTARVVRSKALQIREMGYVQAKRSLGFSNIHIITTDVLLNIFHVVMPKFLLSIASAMIAEASISFLGLGDPSMKSWGMMINFAFTRGGFINGYWWWYLAPGLCIAIFVLSVVLIGSVLEEEEQDALRLK